MNISYRICTFLKATQGNWRNSIYVSCKCESCPYTNEPGCEGFFLSVASTGSPIILSAEEFRAYSGESIDPAECCAQISRTAFEDIFFLFIKWNMPYVQQCPIKVLSEFRYKEI